MSSSIAHFKHRVIRVFSVFDSNDPTQPYSTLSTLTAPTRPYQPYRPYPTLLDPKDPKDPKAAPLNNKGRDFRRVSHAEGARRVGYDGCPRRRGGISPTAQQCRRRRCSGRGAISTDRRSFCEAKSLEWCPRPPLPLALLGRRNRLELGLPLAWLLSYFKNWKSCK